MANTSLVSGFFRFVTDFHQKIALSALFINYVNDYFLKCVGGNPISLLALFSFNQCSWIVSNSISPFSLDDANGNLIFCQSWTTQELLSKIPSMIFIYNFLIVSSKRLCTKWGVIVHQWDEKTASFQVSSSARHNFRPRVGHLTNNFQPPILENICNNF